MTEAEKQVIEQLKQIIAQAKADWAAEQAELNSGSEDFE